MLKYLTPYLLETEIYIRLDMKKVIPVYCSEIRNDGRVSISIYNEDLTAEINSYAWLDEDDLIPYDKDTQQTIQNELDDIWGVFDCADGN